jgi:Protein of unknown function (DUF3179)
VRVGLSSLLLALALVAAGCGGGGTASPSTAAGGGTKEADEGLQVPTAGWNTDFAKHTVPLDEFLSGGPGKDGIPAIEEPKFVSIAAANEWLAEREPVIELELDGVARAYPLQILIWHEIVNDTVSGTPVAVTFCPLCNTALVFDRRLDSRILDFGTTGNLRNSDLVMYDRQTETWWQQFGGQAIVGELAGKELRHVPARIVAWEDFAARHPDGEVLSRDTGFSRPYGQNPYTGYDDVDSGPFFGAANADDDRLPPKERVVYVERGGDAVAVPLSWLAQQKRVVVEVGGEQLEVLFTGTVSSALDSAGIAEGRQVPSADVTSLATGDPVPFDQPFWFAVAAFRPDVRVVGRSLAANAGAEAPPSAPKRPSTGHFSAA